MRAAPEQPLPPPAPQEAGKSVWDLIGVPMLRRLLFVNWLQAMAWDVHTFVLPILGHERGMSASTIGALLGAVQPMVLSLLHQVAPPQRQGEAMALRVMTINFSSFLMPMLFGSIGAVTGVAGLFWLVCGALALGARAIPALQVAEPPDTP